ncbi:DNA-directed RNA polymerase subunit alpha [Candidatus Sneabacter namystus]|uniref:DNA-directed RNA polymerase subunit alpha n=1 Tax=Candidatus Sneabacter namystus TaxID=2601646 RepID=A0A5C0UIQ7_9RICK|nr:DNA-directed RNA polymerase subunit alpha [Candidatus Sneabacter namystus]QEK39501.1 DNA-directed RNA polymerase subunit alpha [Candidatus Sneabacter namystus]
MSLNKNWTALIKPEKFVLEKVSCNTAKVVISPLEKGFGVTIGNALRRVLLSSIQGYAIVGVRIPGATHEFASIPEIKEDMMEIILNLKSVNLSIENQEQLYVTCTVQGPCDVKASVFEENGVKVFNPDQHICTVTGNTEIQIGVLCRRGHGYVPAESFYQKDIELAQKVVWIDALFSPIHKVAFKVSSVRVGQKMDYDKLTLDIESDGSVDPEMAVGLAAKILQEQLQTLIPFDTQDSDKQEKSQQKLQFSHALLKKVEELDMSVRSHNCLKNANIVYVGDLVTKTEAEMLKTPNFGRKSLSEIKEMLSVLELDFGMSVPTWPPANLEELAKKHKENNF